MKKAILLPLISGGTLSLIYFLPQAGAVAESAIQMALPETAGNWQFQSKPASSEELGALSADTKFSKAICLSARPGEINGDGYRVPDRIDLSVVLSGSDLNNSIHRPERCMPAQGHTITSSSDWPLKLNNGREFLSKRLVSTQSQKTNTQTGRDTYVKHNCITYYFFVGHDNITNSHIGRTVIDMKDRIIHGMDQRWAYVSVSMWYGKVPWIDKEVTEAEADKKLRKFLVDFSEKQISWNQITQ